MDVWTYECMVMYTRMPVYVCVCEGSSAIDANIIIIISFPVFRH